MNFIKKHTYLVLTIINLVLSMILFITLLGSDEISMAFTNILIFHFAYFFSYPLIKFQLLMIGDENPISGLALRFMRLFAYIFISLGVLLVPILLVYAIFDDEGRRFAWAVLATPLALLSGGTNLKKDITERIRNRVNSR